MQATDLTGRVQRLLQYLRAMQEMRTRPVRSLDEYPRVFWLSDVPTDDARCATAWTTDIEHREGVWLSLERVAPVQPPRPPEQLAPWIPPVDLADSSLDRPRLLDVTDLPIEVVEPSGERRMGSEHAVIEDHPQVRLSYQGWLPRWQEWASRERVEARMRHAYNSLYALYQEQRGQTETLEIILGMGLLRSSSGGNRVQRHLVTVGAVVELDLDTGRLVVKVDPDSAIARLEEDMLDAHDRVPGPVSERIRSQLDDLGVMFGDDGVTPLVREWTNAFRSDATFSPSISRDAEAGTTVVLAPALILRRRGRESFIQAIDTVATQLDGSMPIPESLAQILRDPQTHHEDDDDADSEESGRAADSVGPETYFPMPSNEQQREIVDRLRREQVVVVQGPPGTGKTHTIANLVTDLLAHGQRVLITSHGSRALKVLKDKLPDEVRDLCVNLADISVHGKQDLQRSVETIIDRVGKQSISQLDKEYERLRKSLQRARGARTKALDGLRAIREQETQQVPAYRGPYSGTPQQIAERIAEDEPTYSWIGPVPSGVDPIKSEEMLRFVHLLNAVTDETHQRALQRRKQSAIMEPEEFDRACRRRRDLGRRLQRLSKAAGDEFDDVMALEPRIVGELQRLCDGLFAELQQIMQTGHAWAGEILPQMFTGPDQVVSQRRQEVADTLEAVQSHLEIVASHHVTGLDQIDVSAASGALHNLASHLAGGGALRRLGRPTKPAREAEAALAVVRVDGRPCTTAEGARVAAAACALELRLRDFESRWGGQASNESQRLRAAWIESVLATLDRILALKPTFDGARSFSARIASLRNGRWYDPAWVERLADQLASSDLDREIAELERRMQAASAELRAIASGTSYTAAISAARTLEEWDAQSYASIWPSLEAGWEATRLIDELTALRERMRSAVPGLAEAIEANPSPDLWEPRAHLLAEAYAWAEWDSWLKDIVDPVEEVRLRKELDRADVEIKKLLLQMASNRAWRYCQSRMTPLEQQSLKIYATSSKRIGKGTGKYVNKFRREARKALATAQTAVPAWIMPLRSVVDSVPFDRPNIFDVVIIDEASQSGHEALLLLWLGKRILVVGDDEQISPENIGLDWDAIFHQQEELLYDLPTRALFGPTNSFLDHAEALAPKPVMLLEHFRCMPEIIEPSNRLSYNRRLLPVRQFGLDRLQPLRRTYIRNARAVGDRQRVRNEAEALQLVETVEKCCADPAYDGKSMGVITFLGSAQARRIADMLLDRLGSVEIEKRGLRVDKPEAFQGDERDVIFMSLVASPEGEDGPRRIGAMTKRADQQRMNVAASRARDQVWVFHSFRPEQLPSGDFRRQYLEYLDEPIADPLDHGLGEVQPDVPHEAFDSIFEQRVFLAITKRGYRVRPQYPVGRYRIDLVVEGGMRRLAVECDGDAYHDEDREVDDVLRQRELERLGWTFWRIRGSRYFRDPEGSLTEFWDTLDRLGIEPVAAVTPVSVHEDVDAPDSATLEYAEISDGLTEVHKRDVSALPAETIAPERVPDGAIVVGARSLDRLRYEAEQLGELIARGAESVAVGDSRVSGAVRRAWERREQELRSRLDYVNSVLQRAFVVEPERLGDAVWPGAVIRYRNEARDDVTDAIVSTVDLADEAYERISPTSALGKLLSNARPGQRLSYATPKGDLEVVEIMSVSD